MENLPDFAVAGFHGRVLNVLKRKLEKKYLLLISHFEQTMMLVAIDQTTACCVGSVGLLLTFELILVLGI